VTEANTRIERIDNDLAAAGWRVDDATQVTTEFLHRNTLEEPRVPYRNQKQFSDYALLGKNGRVLAIVEAKKTSTDARVGREQAKQYCERYASDTGHPLPFCFYTNGHDIYFWNLGQAPPKKVIGFPSRSDLERLAYLRDHQKPLARELLNPAIAGRPYQMQAIREVTTAIEQGKTKFLLVMATGTGKTRTAIALVDVLMRAARVERTLFLVDRVELRNQALEAFGEHLPHEPRWPKTGEKLIATDRRIYVATYPTMRNIIEDEDYPLSPHFFDLVIVDESHRSIYNTYGKVLDYFNTLTLGLTATPTDVIDHNTFQLFECDNGLPTFAYTYDEAVNNTPPYLADFQVMKLRTKFQEQGIRAGTISLEEQKQLIIEGREDEIQELNFEGKDLERSVTNRGTNVTIVQEFMEESIKDPDGVIPGKSIFFCASIRHARQIEEIFETLYPEYKGELARVMVSEDPRVYGKGGLLDQFKRQDMPRIAISVDMLDTGIDVRELVNLVFAKPVFSFTKFWQMIGRGTRLLDPDRLRPWCPAKDVFLIIDCWDNFDYFEQEPSGKTIKPSVPLPVRFAGLLLDKIEEARTQDAKEVVKAEVDRFRQQIDQLPASSVTVREARAVLEQVRPDAFWDTLDDAKLTLVRQQIIPLFRAVSQTDFKAMRFAKDVLEASLAKLQGEDDRYHFHTDGLRERIAELPITINTVARHASLIKNSLTNSYWENATDADLQHLSDTLAPLMQFRATTTGPGMVELNFSDPTVTKETVTFGPANQTVGLEEYRKMVEDKIAELSAELPALQKIKAGEAVTEAELRTLADRLAAEDPHVTEALLKQAYQNRQADFLDLLRHLLGVQTFSPLPDRVSQEVDTFIGAHPNLTARQIEFMQLLRDYIVERGFVEKRDLIAAPFTIIHPKGVRGVFSPALLNDLLSLTAKFAA
jgi:type I restriction enzyme R subunit